ncbi:TonB-dependent receptor [Halioxenophilus sp. WMMB6]|uniref:TonB-dependent receptor n=1 Tax=Halioxenophilus sp. WMMB6 TaxID=3073815 RepID=UPI00295E6CA8|nr:TonB-dependent receptor [Halioxenophilus sp. WMMB6]
MNKEQNPPLNNSYKLVHKAASLSILAAAISSTIPMQTQAADSSGLVLEEIVVTAQRRSENVQDVPIAITAVSGDRLEQLEMGTPVDIFAQAPNVTSQLPTGGTGFPIFNIRGVTMLDFTDTNEASVASYVDDIYLGSPAIQNGQLFDIDRVEILRGPQGTLYGRNATGGLVHFITRRPTEEFNAYISAGMGSYDEMRVEGAISGPLTDSTRGRLALVTSQRDGWQKNRVTGGDFGDVDQNTAVRMTLESDLTEALSVTGNLHYGRYEGETDQRAFFGKGEPPVGSGGVCSINDIMASKCVDYSTGHSDPNPDPEVVYSDLKEAPITNENMGGWLNVDWDIGGMTLTSITSYDQVDKSQIMDLDNSPAPLYKMYFTVDHEQMSQEFRLAGDTDTMNWVTGLYYYQDDRFFTVGFPQLGGYGTYAEQEISTSAAFAQATWSLSETVNLTLGGRYTRDSRDLTSLATGLFAGPGSKQGLEFFNVSRSLDANKFTWRAALDWHFSKSHMLYTSVSTGFKSGAFNALYPASADNVTTADPEETTTYELGVKGNIDSIPLSYNIAAFYNNYESVQAQGSLVVDGTPQSALATVADAKIQGLEAELTAMPLAGLIVTLGMGYLDAEYDAPADALFNGVLIDGNRPVMTPEFSYSGSIRYEMELANAGTANVMMDFQWADKVYFGPDNLPTERQESYGLINLHAGWESTEGAWQVSLFVKNATDEEYFTHGVDPAIAAPNQTSFTWGMPRTWGAKIKRSF